MPDSTPQRQGAVFSAVNLAAELAAGEAYLRDYLAQSGRTRYIVGLSGGLDSAVVAMWAARAVGADRLLLVAMPYGLRQSARFPASTPDSLRDAERVVALLPGVAFQVIDIAPAVDATMAALDAATRDATATGDPADPAYAVLLGNTKARLRAVVLRGLANRYRGLVLGTENRTEHLLGYFTLGGDEESDLELLSPYLKTHVRALARALGVPPSILAKAPSADLWVGQTDEGELGFTYDEADCVLDAAVCYDDPTGSTAYREPPRMACVTEAVAHAVLRRVQATAYKRHDKPRLVRPAIPLASRDEAVVTPDPRLTLHAH